MKSINIIAIVILALISIYFSALAIWIDPEFNNFKDLLSPGVWVFLLTGSILWWALLITLFQFLLLRIYRAFLVGTFLSAISITSLIAFFTSSYNVVSFIKLSSVILILISVTIFGVWGLSTAIRSLVNTMFSRTH
jgi:hypothetical protein